MSKITRRTRNRITQHPQLVFIKRGFPQWLSGKECALFKCECHWQNWIGWLPVVEVMELRPELIPEEK